MVVDGRADRYQYAPPPRSFAGVTSLATRTRSPSLATCRASASQDWVWRALLGALCSTGLLFGVLVESAGAAWTAPQQLLSTGGTNLKTASDGSGAIVWATPEPGGSTGTVLSAVTRSASGQWSPPGPITGNTPVSRFDFVADRDGRVTVAWERETSRRVNELVVSSGAPGDGWTAPRVLGSPRFQDSPGSNGRATEPAVTITPSGTVALAWTDAGGDLAVATKPRDGSWDIQRWNAGLNYSAPRVSASPDGRIVVVRDTVSTADAPSDARAAAEVALRTPDGGWSSLDTLTGPLASSSNRIVGAAAGIDGTVTVLWQYYDRPSTFVKLQYRSRIASGTWTSLADLSSWMSSQLELNLQIAASAAGTTHAVWHNGYRNLAGPPTTEIDAASQSNSTGRWTMGRRISNIQSSVLRPSLVVSSSGVPVVAWEYGAWSGWPGTLNPVPWYQGSVTRTPSVALLGDNTAMAVWQQECTGDPCEPSVMVSTTGGPEQPPPPPPETSCPDVQVVGVRGSRGREDEPSPLDDPFVPERASDPVVAGFVNRLRERTGLNVEPRWIRYDAAYALRAWNSGWDWGRSGEYNSSVDGGIEELGTTLRDLQRRGGCIDQGTRVVLAGFSQGAQIIGRAADAGMSTHGVNAIALFGDPTFSVDHSGDDVSYTSTLGKPTGTLGGRGKDFPSGIFVTNFCRPRDFICDSLGGTAVACAPFALTCNPAPEHGRYNEPIVVGSGPFWDYEERTLPPPTVQDADKIAALLLSLPDAGTRMRSASPRAASEAPVVVFPRRVTVRPNQAMVLSAGLSYDPAGTPLLYEWDLDGDGDYDSSPSSESWVEVSFADTPIGSVGLRITSKTGMRSTALLHVEVASTAPSPPSEPMSLQATPGTRNVRLTWDPPADTGGLPITGYQIRDTTTGVLLGFVDTSRDVTVANLTPGVARSFRVAARNDAGNGSDSASSASVVPYEEDLPSPVPPPAPPPAPAPSPVPAPLPPGGGSSDIPAPPGTTSGPGTSPSGQLASLVLRLRSGPLRRSRLGRRTAFAVGCQLSQPGTCSVRATITRQVARRLGIKTTKGKVVIARGRTTVPDHGWETIRMRTTKRFRSAVHTHRRTFKIRLSATAVTAKGARQTASKTVPVR